LCPAGETVLHRIALLGGSAAVIGATMIVVPAAWFSTGSHSISCIARRLGRYLRFADAVLRNLTLRAMRFPMESERYAWSCCAQDPM
jgi:hypothetical protein